MQDVVAPGQMAFRHDRRHGVGHGLQEASDRLAGRDGFGEGFTGVQQCMLHVVAGRGEALLGEVEQPGPVVRQRIPDQIDGAEVLARWRFGHRREFAGLGFSVEQETREVHASDAVGQAVVQFHDDGGLTALQALDERVLPQRPIAVQAGHSGLARELQNRFERLGFGRLEPAYVPRQVEVGIDHPAGGRQPKRCQDHLVPEAGRQSGGEFEPFLQPIPIRRAVEDQDDDDGRTQQWVLLHVPGEGITVAHVNIHVLSHRHHTPRQLGQSLRCAASLSVSIPPGTVCADRPRGARCSSA